MTTTSANLRDFEAKADSSQREAERLEIALRESAKEEAAYQAERKARAMIRDRLVQLVEDVAVSHGLFVKWRDELDLAWSKSAAAYDRSLHLTMEGVAGQWFDIHRKLVHILDWYEGEPDRDLCKHSDQIRQNYRTMLSVELMDAGDMPDHMKDLTYKALRG